MSDVWTSSTAFLSFSLMKLFHIDLYDHQTSFYSVEKMFNSNFVRHHHQHSRPGLISTYCAFIFAKSYFSHLNTRSTSEKSTTDLQTASFFQRRRKYYYYCNIAAASSGLPKTNLEVVCPSLSPRRRIKVFAHLVVKKILLLL